MHPLSAVVVHPLWGTMGGHRVCSVGGASSVGSLGLAKVGRMGGLAGGQ